MNFNCYHFRFLAISMMVFINLYAERLSAQSPQIINFTKQDYKAASQNWSVVFNKEGLAYFGNNMGLLEFDGITWSLYPSPNSSIIRTVAISDDNKIYTGGYRELGFWEKNQSGVFKYHSLSSQVEDQFTTNEEFWNIFILDNKVYFHSFSGIFIYESGRFQVIKPGGSI